MRRSYLLGIGALLALVLSALPASAGSAPKAPDVSVSWRFAPDFAAGGTRFDGAYVPSLKRVYFLGFRTFANLTDGSIWYYDTVARTYTDTLIDMPVPVSNYGIAALTDPTGLGLYIFGGRTDSGAIINTVQVFYPATNTTAVLTHDKWPGKTPANCISLPAGGVAVVANRGFVVGGASFSTSVPACVDDNSAQTWVFDPMAAEGTRWSPGPALNLARGYITTAVLGNRIYAIGGDTNVAGTLFPQTIVEVWKPLAGTWDDASVADLPVGCDESQAFVLATGPLANGITLAGCGQWPQAVPDTYFYNRTLNTWTLVGSLNEPRRNHAGALIPSGGSTVMFVVGGYDCPANTCLADPTTTTETGKGAAFAGAVWASVAGAVVDARPATN